MKKIWKSGRYIFVLVIMLCMINVNLAAKKKQSPWHDWLNEVDLIMTRMERGVAKILHTEEQQSRFKELFWKARDPNPNTPENEFKQEFYRRFQYAEEYLNGVQSDRGRIYVLLGKPHQKNSFSGHQDLVECELWSYQGEDRPGLLPFMNLVFFRPRNTGDFQLYHPGIHTSRDLLAPHASQRYTSELQSYRTLKMNSGELADASLSIIPGEGNIYNNTSIGTSNFALNRIYSLPEREAELGYIQSFKTPGGHIDVTHTTRHIRGYGYIAQTENEGIHFVHYALMPEALTLKETSIDLYSAVIDLYIDIETIGNVIVYQQHREIDFKADLQKKEMIGQRGVVFRDFAPVIPGKYRVLITFMNRTTQEFFSHEEKIVVEESKAKQVSLIMGYEIKKVTISDFFPFTVQHSMVLTDPRSTFSKKDELCGIVTVTEQPVIFLQLKDHAETVFPIETTPQDKNMYSFRLPLMEIKDGTYFLHVKVGKWQDVGHKIFVMPPYIEITRPFVMERPQPPASISNYYFVQGQQYLNTGHADQAIVQFNRIPKNLWNAVSLPIIAKAYYVKGNYKKVLELLESVTVKKEYANLVMLANSAIETKQYKKALQYLQQIRKYGDTKEINQSIAAAYLSIGDREKAKIYYNRSKDIHH